MLDRIINRYYNIQVDPKNFLCSAQSTILDNRRTRIEAGPLHNFGIANHGQWSKDEDIQKFLSDCKDCSDYYTVVITPWSIAIYEPKDFEVYLEILKE